MPPLTPVNPSDREPLAVDESDSSSGAKGAIYRYIPALDSLRTYSWHALRADVLAGLTVAAVAVPQAMAYATIAGLSPQFGLYTAIVMTAVGAVLDSSKQLINGPTNAISIAILSALSAFPENQRLDGAILLAFLIGITQTAITLLRLGDLTRFISHSVIVGFTVGASILLVMDQLKNLLGLPSRGDPHDHFLWRFGLTMAGIGEVHPATIAIGFGSIALALALRWISQCSKVRLPEYLLTVACMAGIVGFLQLDQTGVKIVGEIPPDLPAPKLPNFNSEHVRSLMGSAFAVGLLGLLEAIAMAKAIASRTGQKLDINQQCLSEGLANLVGSFFQCFPGSGSLTRSAINVQAGAVSQWSGVFCAVAVALTVVFLAPWAYFIPRASLAGILMISAWNLIDRQQLAFHVRATRFDAGTVFATAFAAVAISVEFCILIGIFLSFVMFVHRAARVYLTELIITPERIIRERVASDQGCDRILMFSMEGELFFGSSPDLERHFETIERRLSRATQVVVLRLKRVRNPDAICLELFEKFVVRMNARNVRVLLCGVRSDFAKVLRKSGIGRAVGMENIFFETTDVMSSTLEATKKAYEILQGDLCEGCPRRNEKQEVLYYMI